MEKASATVFVAPGLYSMVKSNPRSLIEEEFEAIVVGAHQEPASPEVWAPMADGMDEAD